ncbi:ATP-binding cassette domain-containing protein [Halomicroarcula sp. GCM10025709]|uniref:ATP-binding cassette domain-containing protein n=1 Tax=Haloarcula TaxID=2237 RepID=UPI0024C3F3A8|nr:ATP-binding cassette domain-containing protein [Halomicroarcula sp. YJ-61-S]
MVTNTSSKSEPQEAVGAGKGSPSLIRLDGISKRYEGVQALSDISFSIDENEILALVGDNGAGKSTLVKILAGVISQTAGDLYVRTDGSMRIRSMDDPKDARSVGIETVFQDLGLSMKHDVATNIYMGREPRKAGVRGRVFRNIDREQMNEGALEALNELGFQIDPYAPVSELSGGQQQAVAVARALISDPRIVLLDEPTAEVSVEGRKKILDLITELKDRGRTVLFITHNLEEVFEVADRIAVLRNGELVSIEDNDATIDRERLVGLMTGAINPE